MAKGNWSSDAVIQAVRDRAREKKGLISTKVCRDNWRLHDAARDLFGSWGAAVNAAGFDYNQVRQAESKARHHTRIRTKPAPLTRGAVLSVIQRMVALDELPNRIRRKGTAIYLRACEEFGSWEKAIVAAGYDSSLAQHPTQSGIPGVFIQLVSLEKARYLNSNRTLGDYLGHEDPGFERFESRSTFESLLKARKLGPEREALLMRIIDGDDLTNEEYDQLALAIQEHPELMAILAK